IRDFPASLKILEKCRPVYKTLKGWDKNTFGLKDKSQLPEEAWEFIKTVEEETGVPVVMLSTGPERSEYIWLK
ncbi:MAG TPA: adenylosuccinate synthase, partial [Persephonella sp.]|nr:adenylosuccinate synthase [Persephonella sp.]